MCSAFIKQWKHDIAITSSSAYLSLLEQPQQYVGADGALMRLIDHHDLVPAQAVVQQGLSQQHAVGHVLDAGGGGGAVVKADLVAHLEAARVDMQ